MNTEIFVAFLAALVVYRVVRPLIDAINPLAFFSKPKASEGSPNGANSIYGIPGGPKTGSGGRAL